MRSNLTLYIIVFICLLSAGGCQLGNNHNQPIAKKGVLDLRGRDFDKDGPISLKGEWSFYWNQLLKPEAFQSTLAPEFSGFFDFPSTWNDFKINDIPVGGFGYATFRLLIKVDSDKVFAIKALEMAHAYSLWINSKKSISNGIVGTSADSMEAQYLSKTAVAIPKNGTIELVLQISNFVHKRGGPWNSVEFGTVDQINHLRDKNLIMEFFLFGAIFIMAFYHLGLFVLRKKERSTLYFGVFCLLIALRVVATGERIMHAYLPILGWENIVKLEYLTFYVSPVIFVAFLSTLYSEFTKIAVSIIGIVSLGFSSMVIFSDATLFSYTLPYFQTFVILGSIYVIVCVVLAMIHKKEGSALVATGSVVLIATLIYDILETNLFIFGINLAPFGLFFFIFMQSFMLSIRLSKAFTMAEELSIELENKVEERTKGLKKANEEIRLSNEQLKETQSQLLQSQKMEAMGTMAGGIAHEFNNILGTIMGYAELLKNTESLEKDERDYSAAIFQSGERASDLVRQILTFSRVDNQQLKPLEIQKELKEVIGMMKVTLPESVDIKEDISDDCRPILANQTQISQVLVNLCMNAEFAMRPTEGGALEIQLKEVKIQKNRYKEKPEAEGSHLKLSVEDEGIGMSTSLIERIFDPFFTTKAVDEGSGLGLSIVHGIVSNHYGFIHVESKQGQGTRFDVFFPVTSRSMENEEKVSKKPRKGQGRILIVEDDEELGAFYSTILTKLGYETTVDSDGKAALDRFQAEPDGFDLVFSDQVMPNMSGFEMSEQMLKINPNIPVIISTGYSPTVTEDDAKKLGIKCLLIKPVRITTLTEKLSEFIELRES